MGLFGAACGGNTGRGSSSSTSAGGGSKGSTVTLQQWYHQYGEAGTQQAVEKYAAAYQDATVKVQWKPGDYDKSRPRRRCSPTPAPTCSSTATAPRST